MLIVVFGSLLGGAVTSWLTFRGKVETLKQSVLELQGLIESMKAMDTAREKAWDRWREDREETVDERLDSHSRRLESMADHRSRIERLELRVNGK